MDNKYFKEYSKLVNDLFNNIDSNKYYTINQLMTIFIEKYKDNNQILKKKDTIYCLIGLEYINRKINV